MRVRFAKTNGNLFIACSGFPECKNTMNLPKGLSMMSMSENICQKCFNRDKKEVHKFRLEYSADLVNEQMKAVLPDGGNTSGEFCVIPGCDEKYKTLEDCTYSLGKQSKKSPNKQAAKNNQ